jgi:hypothetical protein
VNFVLFSFSSNHFSCGRKKFREREREREREKEKVIDWNRSKLIYYLDYSTFFQRGKINSSQLRAGPTPLNWDSRHWK